MDVTARLDRPMIRGETPVAVPAAAPLRRAAAPRPAESPPPLSRSARRVFAALAVLFVLAVAFKLNGSSCAMYRNARWHDIRTADAPSGLLLSTPKLNRADEWQVWTPAILSQARQRPVAFPASNPALGPGKTPLLMSLPVRYYTTLLRPQLWGYFFLPLDYAFSWHWQCKVFGLFAGMFLLFWTLTDGHLGRSLFGAAMVEFSPFVQWWFSSPSMLPEMLACWAVALVAAMSLLGPPSPRRHLGSMAALVASGTNFFLCCYVGFEMPLLYLGFFLLVGYVVQKRLRLTGLWWLVGAMCLVVAWLAPWFLACLPQLRTVSHTVYPGQRVCMGGHLPLLWYFSAFYDFTLTDFNCPPALGNVCEAANFYPLWVLSLGLGVWSLCRVMRRRPDLLPAWLAARGLTVAAVAYLAGMTLFCFVPFPRWFCDLTLLTHSQEARCTIGVGMAGVFILVLGLGRTHRGKTFSTASVMVACVWAGAVLSVLLWHRAQLGRLQTPVRLLDTWAVAVAFGAAYLFLPGSWFQLLTAGAFCATMATVNPVCAGLPELLASPALLRVQRWIGTDPRAEWATYDSLFGSELIRSCGAHTITGAHTIPDFSVLRALDPSGRDDPSYNRYSSLVFAPENPSPQPVVELYNMVYCKVRITPAQMAARFPEVRFVAVPHPMPELGSVGFRLIDSAPANRLWLYHKEPAAAATP